MDERHLPEESTTSAVIGAFFEAYNALGPGYPEYVYVRAVQWELRASGRRAEREVAVVVYYKGEELAMLRLDLLVEGTVVVEAKSTDELHPGAMRQLYNYLRSTDFEVGLLLHFGPRPRFYRVDCPNAKKRHHRR